MLNKLDTWHNTKQGLVAFALVEVVLAYVFVSLAIDSGSLLQWVLAIILGIGVVQNIVRLLLSLRKKG